MREKDRAVWLTVEEAIQVVELLSRPSVLESLSGKRRQRLKLAVEEIEERLKNADGAVVKIDPTTIVRLLRLLMWTQKWVPKILELFGGVE